MFTGYQFPASLPKSTFASQSAAGGSPTNILATRWAPWAAWLVPLAVYVASLDGAVSYWDTGESQVVPWIFGIAHPTGFPVFTIAAGVFAHVFAIGPVAWRIALFSAIAMSVAAWTVFRILRELDADTWIALGAACVFAFGQIVWTRGTRAEVHALAACFAALTLYFSVRWYVRSEPRSFIAAALCWGLGVATHPVVVLLGPALLVVFCARVRQVTLRVFAVALVALACGLAFYAYLPVRSAIVTQARLDPTLQLGDAPGKAFWDMNHASTWDGFKHEVSGSDYGPGGVFCGDGKSADLSRWSAAIFGAPLARVYAVRYSARTRRNGRARAA